MIDDDLEAKLGGVAGPGDHAGHAADIRFDGMIERQAGNVRSADALQYVARPRSLNAGQRLSVQQAAHGDVAAQRIRVKPLLGVAEAADPPEALGAEAHDDRVLDDAAIVVAHDAIQALAINRLAQVSGHHLVHEAQGVGTGDLDDLLAGHIEETGDLAHLPVFADEVLDEEGFEECVVNLKEGALGADDAVERRLLYAFSKLELARGIGRHADSRLEGIFLDSRISQHS